MAPNPHIASVAAPAPVKAGELERAGNHRLDRVPVLDMEKVEALAEDPRLVIVLDPQALAGVQPPEPTFQLVQNIRRRRLPARNIRSVMHVHVRPLAQSPRYRPRSWGTVLVAENPQEAPGIGDGFVDHQGYADRLETGQNAESHHEVVQIDIKPEYEQNHNKNTLKQRVGLE
jgi:hypothetical protein